MSEVCKSTIGKALNGSPDRHVEEYGVGFPCMEVTLL